MYIRDATGYEPSHTQQLGEPRSGHGTIFIVPKGDGTWWGSWQDPYPEPVNGASAGVEEYHGERAEVVQWAKLRPARRRLIFSPEGNDYMPLD